MSRSLLVRMVVSALLPALAVSACSIIPGTDAEPTAVPTATPEPLTADQAAASFFAAWIRHDWTAMAGLVVADQAGAVMAHRDLWSELVIESTQVTASEVTVAGSTGSAAFIVEATPNAMAPWVYENSLALTDTGSGWAIDWRPQVVHPALFDGRRIQRVDAVLPRGRILDRNGFPLRAAREVRKIGLVPGRVEDLDEVMAALVDALDIDEEILRRDAEAPGVQPDWFVPAATLTLPDFDEVWPDLRPIPGVVFQSVDARQSSEPDIAAHVLGSVGPITAEKLAEWGDPYTAGDIVGRSGLELVYEDQLRGSVSSELRVLEANGNLLSVIHSTGSLVPADLETTLDHSIQLAAEAAIEGIAEPAALVVIDVSTGEVRAVVSRPITGFNRALAGLYPPGSTFKTVTAAAAVAGGATPTTNVFCARELVAGGYPIRNAGGLALGDITMRTAYAKSCNTAFASLGLEVGAEALAAAARLFGFGEQYSLGLNTAGGRYPDPVDDAELAASAIGQGRVQASPLHLAAVAGAVASGSWKPPTLVASPEAAARANALAPEVTSALQDMMTAAVRDGTGWRARSAGVPVAGKTGSAEFGDDDPPQTHAWFIGYSGDLAFAVMVEGGGGGGSVAAPIASKFLGALPG